MSWVFGLLSPSAAPVQRANSERAHAPPRFEWHEDGLTLAAGGIAETCLEGRFADGSPWHRWLVLGLGLEARENGCGFLSDKDWQRLLEAPDPDLTSLDGHFVALRWKPGHLEGFTDGLGLRTLYLVQSQEGVFLSTRLDWLARATGRQTIDLAAFGSHWLTANQLSHRSLIEGIERLGPGGRARCTPHTIEAHSVPWELPPHDAPPAMEVLSNFLDPTLPDGRRLSLALSGGLDSRVLLALLQRSARPFSVHTLGPHDHPDAITARHIAEATGIEHAHYRREPPSAAAWIDLAGKLVAQNNATTPASEALKLAVYRQMHAEGKVSVDGFFGEIARRQYYNRLVRLGRAAFRMADGRRLFPCFQVHRADVFNSDAIHAMRSGVEQELARLAEESRMRSGNDIAQWADRLAVRYRLPNFAGYEQARLDACVVAYMPFAQPSFLRAALQMPLRQRTNGRRFRRLIRRYQPALVRHPLVKGATTYPFSLPTVPAHLWTTAKRKLGKGYVDPTRSAFLTAVSEFVRDMAHSMVVQEGALYDARKVSSLVDRYYAGEASLAAEVDWWLAFASWTRAMRGDSGGAR